LGNQLHTDEEWCEEWWQNDSPADSNVTICMAVIRWSRIYPQKINKNKQLVAIACCKIHRIHNTRYKSIVICQSVVTCATRYGGGTRHSRGLRFAITFRDFFRAEREGSLGVTRILWPVSFRLHLSSLLSPRVDRGQEMENAYYFYWIIHLGVHPHKYDT